MEDLCTKQSVLGTKIKDTRNRGKKNLDKRPFGFIQNITTELKKLWAEFDENDTKLRELIVTSRTECKHNYIINDEYADVQIAYLEFIGELTDQLVAKAPNEKITTTEGIQTIIQTESQSQLPRINLPKFNGDYATWRSFHDLFVSLVHDNSKLPPVQKLHHLKGCLIGEAEQLLRHIPITEKDYYPAWERLKNRYENTRLLVNTQLKILVNQPKLSTESSKGLKSLLDTTEECLQQLKALKVNVSSWGTLLIYLLVQKLPYATLKLWEEELGDSQKLPELKQFQDFLQKRFRVLESMSQSVNNKPQSENLKSYHIANRNNNKNKNTCPACNGGHYVGACNQFLKMTVYKRRSCIEKAERCFNCFSNKHSYKQCPKSNQCRKCDQSHHTLLHFEQVNNVSADHKKASESSRNIITQSQYSSTETNNGLLAQGNDTNEEIRNFFTNRSHTAMLATARVLARDREGRSIGLRCLVDPGSQTSFITEGACKRLELQGKPAQVKITGLNTSQTALSNREVRLQIAPYRDKRKALSTTMLVIKKITDLLPSAPIKTKRWDHLKDLELADPKYWQPGTIDILLGANVYSQILLDGVKRGLKSAPIAIKTTLGWLVLGQLPQPSEQGVKAFTAINDSASDLNNHLKSFREPKEVHKQSLLKQEDKKGEKIFTSTHKKLMNGQYKEKLPFIQQRTPNLGPSNELAIKGYNRVKRKLNKELSTKCNIKLQRKVGNNGNNKNLEKEHSKCSNKYVKSKRIESKGMSLHQDKILQPDSHYSAVKENGNTKLQELSDTSVKNKNVMSMNSALKTKVAPTKPPITHSLESNKTLIQVKSKNIQEYKNKVIAWIYFMMTYLMMINLQWFRSHPTKWKEHVTTRVTERKKMIDNKWLSRYSSLTKSVCIMRKNKRYKNNCRKDNHLQKSSSTTKKLQKVFNISIERILREVLQEEYQKLLTQVEACVKTCSLCTKVSNVDNLENSTLEHLLYGQSLKRVTAPELRGRREILGHRWKQTQQVWTKRSKNFLNKPRWYALQPETASIAFKKHIGNMCVTPANRQSN